MAVDHRPLSRFCICDICDTEELALRAILPDGWVMLWDEPAVLCRDCIKKWRDRWEEPAIWLTGGEKEIKFNEDGSVSKDTAPRRQADFDFV